MFRSVFAKYITVFMLIIAISFIILAGVMTVIVNNYSESLVKNNIQSVAYSSVRYLEAQLDNKNCNDVAFMMSVPGYNADICLTLEAVVENSGELTVLVTDASGNVILVVDNEQTVYKTDYVIPAALMNEIKSEAKFSQKVDLVRGRGRILGSRHRGVHHLYFEKSAGGRRPGRRTHEAPGTARVPGCGKGADGALGPR